MYDLLFTEFIYRALDESAAARGIGSLPVNGE
jgi:hypothetical protein